MVGWGEERQGRRGLVEIMEDPVLSGLLCCNVQLWLGSVMMQLVLGAVVGKRDGWVGSDLEVGLQKDSVSE